LYFCNLLITHPKVVDAAVFGVPNEGLGEVKAAVQLVPGIATGPQIAEELMAFRAGMIMTVARSVRKRLRPRPHNPRQRVI
jgi:acyl-coenzyme A synthetase/AMP-(fatty) acid ligase